VLKEYEGRVRLVFKDLPLSSHEFARPAAEAARCAGAQGKFWAYHDRLFENQPEFDRRRLLDYADQVGVERKAFVQCLEAHTFQKAIDADVEQARALGIKATPTFIINGQPLVGAHPVETFRRVIDEALRHR
jgi:protein-disulfide isomerase